MLDEDRALDSAPEDLPPEEALFAGSDFVSGGEQQRKSTFSGPAPGLPRSSRAAGCIAGGSGHPEWREADLKRVRGPGRAHGGRRADGHVRRGALTML